MKKRPLKTSRREFWLRHLQRHQEMGGRLSDYAKQHNLNIACLYSWKYQLQAKGFWPTFSESLVDGAPSAVATLKKTSPVHFAEVTPRSLAATSLPAIPAITLHLANGIRVECSGINEGEFRWLLQCARELA